MAHINRIECMPHDTLREILSRVAGGPDGAGNIARATTVSRTFRNFVVDEYVLRAVSFIDIFPGFTRHHELLSWQCELLSRRYDVLSEVDGLVARCSRAGNMNAQFVLAKVALVCASTLCNARTNAPRSKVSLYRQYRQYSLPSPPTEDYNLKVLDKATRLLGHLFAQNANPNGLLVLVRNFLCQAKVQDLAEMCPHLKDFVALYLVPGNNSEHKPFLDALDEMCYWKPSPLYMIDPAVNFNMMCSQMHDMMKGMGIDEAAIRPLLECAVDTNDDVAYDTLNERWGIIQPVLELGDQVVSTFGNEEVLSVTDFFSPHIIVFRKLLRQLKEYEAYLPRARGLVLLSFDTLFDIHQASP